MFRFVLFAFVLCFSSLQFSSSHASEYVILPGDVLQITVWKEEGMDQEVVVLPSGAFTFPLLGTINAKGLTPGQLQNVITDRLEPYIQEASVAVSVKAPLGHKVSVIGEVLQPGDVLLSSETTISQALSQAGGFTPYADQDDILVVRNGADGVKEKIEFSFDRFSNGRDLEDDIVLRAGDVVVVPSAGFF